MTNSLIPVAPGLDEPLEILTACHGRVLAQLETLQRLLAHLPEHGADAQAAQAAASVLRYFDTAARHHHDDEELDLIPGMRARAEGAQVDAVATVAERIFAEHALMYAAWAALRPQLVAVAQQSAGTLDETRVAELDTLYRSHIDFEEAELLPLARTLLSAAELEPMSRAMTRRRTTQ